MRGLHIWAATAVAALVIGILTWVVIAPGWAVAQLQEQLQVQLGRKLDVKGGTHLLISPSLAIQIDEASLAAPQGQEGSFVTAKSIRVPISPWQLISHNGDFSALVLDAPDFAFLIDERGHVTWGFPGVNSPQTIAIGIENGSMRFFDARNGQSFFLSGANGSVEVGIEGDVSINGTAAIGGRLARIHAFVKSLPRIHEDGSPLDITVETAEVTATFNGRIATANVFDLTGPVTITSPNLRAAARWAGLAIEDGANYQRFAITGGLDSAGRAFAINDANVELDDFTAHGDIALDFRGDVPKLQAALSAPSLNLDRFLPGSGAVPGGWGSASLGFAALKVLDAEITLQTPVLSYGQALTGSARFVATLAKGKLDSSIALQTATSGNLTINNTIDAGALPHQFSLNLTSENIDTQDILPGLAGISWLSGRGNISASLSGLGQTQQEIIGTLNGTASLNLSEGQFHGINIVTAMGAVSQRILQGWTEGGVGNTSFTSLTASASFGDGIATIGDFKLDSHSLTSTMKGEIDLLRRAVDLRADPRLSTGTAGITTGLPVSIVVKGPWDNPQIYPDMKDILLNPSVAFEALKNAGLSTGN